MAPASTISAKSRAPRPIFTASPPAPIKSSSPARPSRLLPPIAARPINPTTARKSNRSCRAFTARPCPSSCWPSESSPSALPCCTARKPPPARRLMSAVAVEGVWKFYGDYPALRDIRLEAAPGSCLALIGRNGAGKTTLLRIVAGFSKAQRGKIKIHGNDPRDTETRRHLSFLGHGIAVYDELSALENLKLYGLPDPRKSALEWLERTGLERVRNGLVREFSRGMRQRLAVARAFLHEPSVLLLDEPFTALDDRAIAVLQRLLREALAAGKTIVMSTHQLREALELATHVALLSRGQLAFHGQCTPEMVADPGYIYARYGEA